MKRFLSIITILGGLNLWSQTDYGDDWEDYFSYNNVKDIVSAGTKQYAIVDNAVFSYNSTTQITEKKSSINGLSGEQTTSVHYSISNSSLVIGYANGLLEIIDQNNEVKKIVDITLSTVATEKQINTIYEYDNQLYLSMPFGIVVFDLLNQEFGDTFFIGENSSSVYVNDIIIENGFIYAATTSGVYIADITINLSNYENWTQYDLGTDFSTLTSFNGEVVATNNKNIYVIDSQGTKTLKKTLPKTIVDVFADASNLSVAIQNRGYVYDTNYNQLVVTDPQAVTSIYTDTQNIYLGTSDRGILKSSFASPNEQEEIHPEGPYSNDIFSVSVKENHLWCVYGGYNQVYTPNQTKMGYSHFNGSGWANTPYESFNSKDLIHISFDPNDINKVYMSSWSSTNPNNLPDNNTETGGILVVENDQPIDFWNHLNSGVSEYLGGVNYLTIRIGATAFDLAGNLWVTNSLVSDGLLKKRSINGDWTDHHLAVSGEQITNLIVDQNNNIWVSSRNKGLLGYRESDGANVQITSSQELPDNNVRAVAVDKDNDLWIGTAQGLVFFADTEGAFNGTFNNPSAVQIDGDGLAQNFLENTKINDIYIDGANNKWFGTENEGVFQINSTGKKIISVFNKDNSPMPSNKIIKIQMDELTGKIFFVTSKGMVAYNSEISPYGEELTEVYGYPNPSLKQHDKIYIVGKDGMDLPYGANIKILDVSGNLVFESNTVQDQADFGGKIIWDKTNLQGTKVASGVYIVSLYNENGDQTSSTKIAIIN